MRDQSNSVFAEAIPRGVVNNSPAGLNSCTEGFVVWLRRRLRYGLRRRLQYGLRRRLYFEWRFPHEAFNEIGPSVASSYEGQPGLRVFDVDLGERRKHARDRADPNGDREADK